MRQFRRSPEQPGDVDPGATARELLDEYHRHLIPLTAARLAESSTPACERVRHAIAALAIAEVIIDDLRADRWRTALDALRHGATVAQVGAAMADLDIQEVSLGLSSWADGQRRARRMTDTEHAAVLDLVAPVRAHRERAG